MNKIFKVIWNPATGSYSVVSETAKSRGKKSGRSKLLISALVAGGMLPFGASAGEGIDGGTALEDPTQGSHWLAIGEGAKATTISTAEGYAAAIGFNALADGEGSTAFGYATHASGDRSIAFGQYAQAAGNRTMAFGSGANAIADYSLALGGTTYTGGDYSIAIGRGARVEDDADYAASYGYMAKASGLYSLAFGSESQADTENAIAMGQKARARGKSSLALGAGSDTVGEDSIALGAYSYAEGAQSLAFGATSKALETNAIAIGNASQATNINAIALGQGSTSGVENGVAIGSGANATGINSVALGSDSEATEDNTVSVGSSTKMRRIVNMDVGVISLDSTDAINGSQLYKISRSVADRLGGGSTVNSTTGIVNAPSYTLRTGATYSNVGAALKAIDDITLQWSTKDSAYSAARGSDPTSKIINVKDGTIGAGSTDAVNGSQLNTTNGKVDTNTTNIATNTTNISNLGGRVDTLNTTVTANSNSITNLGDSLTDLQEDALQWDSTAGAYNASRSNVDSKITGVAKGDISSSSTDAVNGSQLNDTNMLITQIAGDTSSTYVQENGAGINYVRTNDSGMSFKDASATGTIATAVGYNASSYGDESLAVGAKSVAFDDYSTAIGAQAKAYGHHSLALGAGSNTATSASIALGVNSFASGEQSMSLGVASKTSAEAAIALGYNSYAHGLNSMSLGQSSYAGKENSIALGSESDAEGINSVALGAGSVAEDDNTVSVGSSDFQRKIVNMAAGTVSQTSTDAINGSQLYGLSSSMATYLGGHSLIASDGTFIGPTYNIDGTDYYSVGDALAAIDDSIGDGGGASDALLWDATKNGGKGAYSASHAGDNKPNKITNVEAATLNATSTDAVNGAQLFETREDVNDLSILVDNIDDSVTDLKTDALLWDDAENAFSASHDGKKQKITNVEAGKIAAKSFDAVNGSQLYALSSDIANFFGGGTAIIDDKGTFTSPTYNIDGTDYHSVGDALAAIDDSIGDGGGASDALQWDSTAGEYNANRSGNDSKITGVEKGDISAGSTDAVNGSQLNDTNMLITQIAGDTSATYIQENGAGVNYIRTNDTGLVFEDASASGVAATAVGYNASASGASSIAIGQDSSSTIEGGIALGSGAMSSRVISSGSRATSVTSSGVTIGYDTTDEQLLGALSLGKDGESYRQIINVADGTEAHDVVTVRQLQNAIGSVTTTPTMYFHANSTEEDSLAVGEDSLAMGAKTVVNGDGGIGIGYNTVVAQEAINGIAIGGNASANNAGSVAIGYGSRTSVGAQTNYTAYNMDAPQNSVGEFSVGSEDGQRQITNVAAGSQDYDAVNVGQLKVTDARVSQNTQNIAWMETQINGLDSRISNIENGSGSIVVNGDSKYFKANSTGPEASAQGEESVSIGSGSIAAADNSVALGAGSVADEENTISVGSSSNQRRITNVAAGKNATDAVNVAQLKSSEAGGVRYDTNADGSINYSHVTLGDGNGGTTRISNVSAAVDDNDAVNYAQLKQSVQETNQYTDQRMAQMDNKLSKTESKLSGGIASAMAMTGLPQAYTPGASMASIGGGTYNGESAVALGVSMVSANGRWVYKLQGSTNSQGEYSAAVGAGIQW